MVNRRSKKGRRAPRRWKKSGRKTVNVNRALSPIPQRFITKLKYAGTVTTGANGAWALRLNSLFDPDATGTGHQPYGYDQLSQLYNRYRVISCSYRLQAPNVANIIQFGAMPANAVYTYGAFDALKEQPRARYFTQMPTGNAQTLSGKVYIPSVVGRSKAQYMADDRFQAQNGANPAEECMLNLMVAAVGDNPISGQPIHVILEFTAEFFDVISQAQS